MPEEVGPVVAGMVLLTGGSEPTSLPWCEGWGTLAPAVARERLGHAHDISCDIWYSQRRVSQADLLLTVQQHDSCACAGSQQMHACLPPIAILQVPLSWIARTTLNTLQYTP